MYLPCAVTAAAAAGAAAAAPPSLPAPPQDFLACLPLPQYTDSCLATQTFLPDLCHLTCPRCVLLRCCCCCCCFLPLPPPRTSWPACRCRCTPTPAWQPPPSTWPVRCCHATTQQTWGQSATRHTAASLRQRARETALPRCTATWQTR
jgi:hypothetical protein